MHPIRSGKPYTLFEVTTRTQGAKMKLLPSQKVTDIILGCLGRAQHIHPVTLFAFTFLSNHYHMLVAAQDAEQMSLFMGHLNGNIAKEINRAYGEDGHLWQRRFRSIPVAAQEEAQIERLRYILRHGVKERLVARCRDWPGATSLPWLLDGTALKGVWHSRTDEYRKTRLKGYVPTPGEFETVYTIAMSPLPCWKDLEESVWRELVAEMVAEIEEQEAALRMKDGVDTGVLGVAKVLEQSRERRPKRRKRSHAPCVHAAEVAQWRRWRCKLRTLRAAYAEASALFRAGDHAAEFPAGTFRPHGAFASWSAAEAAMAA